MKAVLGRMGLEHLHDVYLPSRGGVTQVDHVVRLKGALLVIETKNYSGLVVGTIKAMQWTQVHAGGRVRNSFQNPLRQNDGHVLAVKQAIGERVPVVGMVVFAGTAKFGKAGRPEGVVTLSGLRAAVAALEALHPPRAGVATAWDALLMQVAGQDRRAMARAHVATREAAAAKARSATGTLPRNR